MKLSTKIILAGAAVAVGYYLWKRQAGSAAVPGTSGGTGSGAGSTGSRIRPSSGATSSVGIP